MKIFRIRMVSGALIGFMLILAIETISEIVAPGTAKPEIHRFYPNDRVPDYGESLVQWKTHLLMNTDRPFDVLVAGDSSANFGVDPRIIQDATGLTTINLGIDGSYTLDIPLDLADAYLAEHAPPKLMVLHISDDGVRMSRSGIALNRRDFLRKWFDELGLREHSGFILPSRKFWNRVNQEGRAELWGIFDLTLGIKRRGKLGNVFSDQEIKIHIAETSGFIPLVHGKPSAVEPRARELLFSLKTAQRMIRRTFEMAAQRQTPVLVITNPLSEIDCISETLINYAASEEILRDISSPYTNIYIAPLLRCYNNDWVESTAHLTPLGAQENSREIASWITSILYDEGTWLKSKWNPAALD